MIDGEAFYKPLLSITKAYSQCEGMRTCYNLLSVYLPDKLNGSTNWVFRHVKDSVKTVT